jgi:hypothetical protein
LLPTKTAPVTGSLASLPAYFWTTPPVTETSWMVR